MAGTALIRPEKEAGENAGPAYRSEDFRQAPLVLKRRRGHRAVLFTHLHGYLVPLALLDQLIVAARLLEPDIREEKNQNHHPGDRDVIRLGYDTPKLSKSADMLHSYLPCTALRKAIRDALTGSIDQFLNQRGVIFVYQPCRQVSTSVGRTSLRRKLSAITTFSAIARCRRRRPTMEPNPDASHPATLPVTILMLLWGAIATVLGVLYTVVLATLAAVVSPFKQGRITNRIGRFWSLIITRTCGIKVEVTGLEHIAGLKSFVLVTNHQSIFDIFAVMAFIPREIRFIAKKELLRIPIFNIALKRSGHIVVDRQRGGPTVRQALDIAGLGFSICVFAEGHRYTDNQIHPFQGGAAWLAIQTGLPCVPMAISGSGAFFPRGAKLVVPGGRMRLALGPPIATADLKSHDRKDLTRRLEDEVRSRFVSVV